VLFFLLKFITNKIGLVKRKRKKTDVAMSLIDWNRKREKKNCFNIKMMITSGVQSETIHHHFLFFF